MSDSEKISLILELLQGSPLDKKDEGLIGDVRWTKATVISLMKWKDKTMAWIAGGSFIGGGLLFFIIDLLTRRNH